MGVGDDCCSTHLIDGEGEFNATGLDNFTKEVNLGACGLSYAVVSIMGPQSSGGGQGTQYYIQPNNGYDSCPLNSSAADIDDGSKHFSIQQAASITMAKESRIQPLNENLPVFAEFSGTKRDRQMNLKECCNEEDRKKIRTPWASHRKGSPA